VCRFDARCPLAVAGRACLAEITVDEVLDAVLTTVRLS
jgi:hypothetical protein